MSLKFNSFIAKLWFVTGILIIFSMISSKSHSENQLQKATFAGGCFWCVEASFDPRDGVLEVISGYTGGSEKTAGYKNVSSGKTRHVEAIQVLFDPKIVSYKELLEIYWQNIDPTDDGGQFADRGPQYKTVIYYHNNDQKERSIMSKKELEETLIFKKPIVTQILPAKEFYEAENYHQEYYKKNPNHYKKYKYNSGREPFLKKIWGNE